MTSNRTGKVVQPIPHTINQKGGGAMKITFTNIIIIGTRQIRFCELTKKEQNQVSNYLRKTPLETLGNVSVKNSA